MSSVYKPFTNPNHIELVNGLPFSKLEILFSKFYHANEDNPPFHHDPNE